MLHLDIAQLQRKGLFRGVVIQIGWASGARVTVSGSGRGVRLLYSTRNGDGEWQAIKETVPLVATPQQFGGQRRWFGCLGCGTRCRILYGGMLYGSGRFRCRHCHSLRYSSQAETKADRATRRMLMLVKRLDPERHFNMLPAKPKRMHWRTYNRLVERYAQFEAQWVSEAMRRFVGQAFRG